MAFFIVLICVFAPNNSEGRKKLEGNIFDNGVQDIHKHTVRNFDRKITSSSLYLVLNLPCYYYIQLKLLS